MKSENLYICLHRLLIVLLIIEIVVGLSISTICEYVNGLVQSRIFMFDKHGVLSVVFIVKLFGFHVSFYFLCGIPIVLLFNEVYTHHLGFLLKVWMLMTVETAVGSLFINWCFTEAMKNIIENFQESLEKGIKLYPQDPNWVLVWDDLQYHLECCGIHDHTDWMKNNLTTTGKNILKRSNEFSWVPHSCVKGNLSSRCNVYVTDDNIYTNGCFTVVLRMLKHVTSAIYSLNLICIILSVRFS